MLILEKMFYEARPFLYAFIGFYAVAHYENKMLLMWGAVLLGCSYVVFDLRITYRMKAMHASRYQPRRSQ